MSNLENPDEAPTFKTPTHAAAESGVTITPYRDGPLIVRGNFRILDGAGKEIDPGRGTVALCRCGRSALKPFCDGSHTVTGFRATAGDERGGPPSRGDRQGLTSVSELTNDQDEHRH